MLYIRDDCSNDGTWEIVQAYAAKEPDRIVALQNEENSGSAKHNFFKMMQEHQDDQLEVMDPSYRHAVNGNWQRTDLHYELAQNTVTGCTAMYNRA